MSHKFEIEDEENEEMAISMEPQDYEIDIDDNH
jgi:hypothetical protein